MKRLYRSRDERLIAGVAGGLANYFNIDPTLVRLAFVALTLAGSGSGLLAYLILLILMPLEPEPGMISGEARPMARGAMGHPSPEEVARHEAQETQVPEYQR